MTHSRQQSLRFGGGERCNEARSIIQEKSIIRITTNVGGRSLFLCNGAKGFLASVRIFDELVARKSITDKPFAAKNSVHTLQ